MSRSAQRALEEISQRDVWDPAWGEERISNMIATRPDWCISRQRIWGVPIAVFLCERCHEPLNDEAINESRSLRLFVTEHGAGRRGTAKTAEELLPAGTCVSGTATRQGSFARRWTFSMFGLRVERAGMLCSTWSRSCTGRRTLYTEGGDQHRGWFHSVPAERRSGSSDAAPYKMVATSPDGRWMSRGVRFRSRWAMASIRWM